MEAAEALLAEAGKVRPAAKKPAPEAEPELWWKEIAARDDINAILSACEPLTPRDRKFLRIALIECSEMRTAALNERNVNDLPIAVRARLAIHALGEWTKYFTDSVAPLIDGPNEDLDPGIHAALMEAVLGAQGAMSLGPAPAVLEKLDRAEEGQAAAD